MVLPFDLSATIDVEINGIFALTQYTTIITSNHNSAIEGIFHFALPYNGCVIRAEAILNGQKMCAAASSATAATEDYELSSQMHNTLLIESLNNGLFAVNVGYLAPNTSVSITLTIAQILTINFAEETVTYRMPTCLTPAQGQSHSDIEPEFNFFAEYTFDGTLRNNDGLNMTGASHEYIPRDQYSVTFKGMLDRDIHFTSRCNNASASQTYLYKTQLDNYHYVLGYLPPEMSPYTPTRNDIDVHLIIV